SQLQENGITQLALLSAVAQETGVWTNSTLHRLLSNESPQTEEVNKFLQLEGPILLEMRVKHLIKENHMERAALLARACAECPEFEGKGHFKQMYLVCLCSATAQEPLMEELSKVDCRDALEMICNLESEGDERGAFSLCSAFLTRQLLQGDTYCAWELTLFWSKLLKRMESSEETFLDRCRQMSLLSTTVFHILFFIKVIQSEVDKVGLPVCVDMCIRALQLESSDGNTKATICKTISCLLPTDLEVKRACQLTEFLLEPTVDSYYAVETLYNEPDQKLEEENLPVPNSLRCELLLVFKTQWPFDPEFWDWKTLKRHCLTLMGEEASIVSSIDLLNDNEIPEAPEEEEDTAQGEEVFRDVTDYFVDTTHELNEITDKRQKIRETKKLREKGFISARFRNWQAYMQYCVLCDKEFLGHRIVRHAQTHYKDGLYSCPICAETFTSKDTLEPHVASHVKLSCKERLAAIKTNKKLANPKTAAPTESIQTKVSGLKTESSTEENTCPVANCKKGFKYFRNLLVHVKAHRDNEEAKRFLEMQNKKVICQYCRRQFVNVTHLNDHLQVHCGVRPYICIQLNCKASFLSNTELLVHRKEHVVFKARCMFPRCGKIFNEAYKLYDHESQHYKTFTCKVPNCGKVFHSQSQLDLHQEEHVTKEEEYPATDTNLSHFLDQRMLSDQASFSEDVDEATHPSASVEVKHSIDNLNNSESQDATKNAGEKNQMGKKVKRNKRTKWPAIVKDGKFICSRCGREFTNPKSLGGHLSKRLHCKAYDTELLTADLPSSFLDLLNSEQLLNTQPPPSSQYNPAAPYANDGEQPDEILKQIMASSQHHEVPAPTCIVAHDVDLGPNLTPANQQHWIMDIQTALERLNLDKQQVCDSTPTYSSTKPSCTDICNDTESFQPNVSTEKDTQIPDGCRKLFACESDNCTYRAMTKDAILKHLIKTHNYTNEMINLIKKNHGKFAPFSCQMCDKTFTRNSNLKAHCQTAHRLTQQEIAELIMKRKSSNTVGFANNEDKPRVHSEPPLSGQISTAPHSIMENIRQRAGSMTLAPSDPLQVCAPLLEKTSKIKPYRCVHQGCAAAFTIQHNLILHYRAVHQSALSTCEMNNENDQNEEQDEKKGIKQEGVMEEEPEVEVTQVTELRCQVSDCSRVFQDVPNMLQHYLQLHKFSLDKAGSLMSNINLGRFRCDHQGCTASFIAFWKYIGHIEKEHDKAKLAKMEPVDGMFQCDVEGCDRAYATKSNLLRHTMKKHHDLYKLQLMNQRKSEDCEKPDSKNLHYQITKSSDKKKTDKTEKNSWTKYGKPSLKTKDEASAMCIKKCKLQYPCMIKGCDSVMKSERSIMKHYMGHGLSERYLEEQRSHFIFCKKYPRRRNLRAARSDDSKSETSSEISDSEDTADTGLEGSEFDEYSKPVLRRKGRGELCDTKPSYDESSETASDGSVVVKRKRGSPRKSVFEKIVKRKRLTRSNAVYCGENGSDYDSSSPALTQDEMNDQSETLTSFKPMGFEVSFLKFLEQSSPSKNALKKRIRLRNATVLCKRSDTYLHYPKGFDTLEFRNPQKLTSLKNVKIVVDKAFSDVADTLLKQLQEMRPTVILEK
uniref:Zinc finger protein 292b n=1 Tax=Hucho hucho TaxID=62062 RepID=A0A4W5PPA5_9TELE